MPAARIVRKFAVGESKVVVPSDMICAGDSVVLDDPWLFGGLFKDTAAGFDYYNPTHTNYQTMNTPGLKVVSITRHGDADNVVFLDGHVEKIKAKDLFSSADAWRRRWNNDNQSHKSD